MRVRNGRLRWVHHRVSNLSKWNALVVSGWLQAGNNPRRSQRRVPVSSPKYGALISFDTDNISPALAIRVAEWVAGRLEHRFLARFVATDVAHGDADRFLVHRPPIHRQARLERYGSEVGTRSENQATPIQFPSGRFSRQYMNKMPPLSPTVSSGGSISIPGQVC